MQMQRMSLTLAASLAAGLLLAGCAGMGAPITQGWTPPPPGTEWEVAQRNTGSYGPDRQINVRFAESSWEGRPALAFINSQGGATLVEPDTGRWLAILGPGGKPVTRFSPALGWDWPLFVGKAWTTRYRMTIVASGRDVDYDLSCKVEAWEKVALRAGEMEAYRIACTSSIGNDEVYWSSPRWGLIVKSHLRRDASNPFGAGTQEAELATLPARR